MSYFFAVIALGCGRAQKDEASAQQRARAGDASVLETARAATASISSVSSVQSVQSPAQPLWVGSILGVELQEAASATAPRLDRLEFATQVVVPVGTDPAQDWVRVQGRAKDGWVRRNCLTETRPTPINGASLDIFRGFVRAALDRQPLTPFTTAELIIEASTSDRYHGSGMGTRKVPATALTKSIDVQQRMDGTGWHLTQAQKTPHRLKRSFNLYEDLKSILAEVCVSEINGTKLSYTSMSGYLSIQVELVDTPSGPRVGKISSVISDPG